MVQVGERMRDGKQHGNLQQQFPLNSAASIASMVLHTGVDERAPLETKPRLGIVLGTGMGSLVEHIQEKNHVRYISHSDKDGRSDMRKNLKCDLCGEMFPCYSLLKQHKYERKGITKSGLFPSVARPYYSEGL